MLSMQFSPAAAHGNLQIRLLKAKSYIRYWTPLNSILLNLVANTIGLVIPKWFNTLYGKELFEGKPSNWFYGSFALTLTALLICQYTDSTTIRFIANLITGGNAYITALCFNMILKQNEEIALTNSHNEEEDNKHNNSPKVVIRLMEHCSAFCPAQPTRRLRVALCNTRLS